MSDPYVHENLTADARNRALEIARSMSVDGSSINTKLLERVLSNPTEFNNYPLKSRQALFERLGVQPAMAATESKGSIGFGSLFDAINTTKQEYQKAEPTTKPTDLFSALTATKQEYEKQKNTQAMGDISQEAKLRETLVAGVPEVVKKDASGRVIEEPKQRKVRNVREFLMEAPVETALTLGTGAITAPIAAVEQLGSDIYGKITGKPNVGQDVFKARMQAGTYVPRTESGKEMVQTVGKAFEATKLPPVLAPELTAVSAAGRLPPAKPEGKPKMTAKEYETTRAIVEGTAPQFKQDPAGLPGLASVGAAGRRDPVAIRAAIDALPVEMQGAARNIPTNRVNLQALESHAQALNLPVPINLTRGQATGDLVALSNELNLRGELQNIAYRMGETNKALIENLSAIRDRAAPDLPGSKSSDFGQIVIDTYKGIDSNRLTNIGNLYKNLETAAGGDFPIDSRAFVNNADIQLSKKLKSEFVPATIQRQLQAYRDGGKMDFEQFEALRSNLYKETTKAQVANSGNEVAALSIIRDSLEELPLTGGAAALKPLADAARAAARERFQALDRDPAYKAAVNDKVAAENFVNTFVLSKGKGTEKNVQTMMDALGKGTDGQYAVAANIIEYLRGKSVDQQGNFSQAAYNKALKELDPKMQNIFDGATAQTLRDLGEVSRKVMAQPKGSFANNSNTFVAALSGLTEKLGKGAEQALNLAIPGASIGTAAAQVRARRAGRQFEEQSLEPLAGVKGKSNLIRDILSKKE
jgi:hypothetical protein